MIGSGGLKRSSSRYRSPPPDAYYPLCGRLSDLLAGFWRSRRVAKNRISSTIKMVQRTGTLTERAHRIAEQYLDDPAQWAAKDGRCASCWQIFAVLVRRGSHVCVTLLLTTSSHDLTLSRAARVVPCRMIQELPQQLEVPALALRWGDGADRGGVCWLMRMCIHVLIVVHWWLLAALLLLLQAPLTSHPRPVS